MGQASGCRVLAVIGSGETSPTMVTVHKDLLDRLGTRDPAAVLIQDPYAFQENAADVSARAVAYFAHSVGLAVTVVASPGVPGERAGPGHTAGTARLGLRGPGEPVLRAGPVAGRPRRPRAGRPGRRRAGDYGAGLGGGGHHRIRGGAGL
jgi:hypothetical protein